MRTQSSVPRRPRAADHFLGDAEAVSAVEFAFVVPVIMILLVAGFDCGRFVLASEKAESVAHQIAQMLSESPPNSAAAAAGDALITSSDILTYYNAAPFIYPDVLEQAQQQGVAWTSLIKLDMASVRFTTTPSGCTSSCNYTPTIVWNYGDASYLRPCGSALSAAADTSTSNPATLPTDVFGPNSTLVVDVHYAWTPTFGAAYFGSVTIARSIYLNPRYVPLVEASGGNGVNIC